MKKGCIFLLAILLIMPFAFAGQVSDFFSYFTSDAFSLITGAQIAGFGRNNPAINNPADDLARNTERTNNPPVASANGVTCRAHTDCKSGVCTKVSAQKAICGKKTGEACTTGAKSKCFSNNCVSGRCGLSPLGKSCITKADCVQGLTCKNNKCTRPTQAAPTTPAALTSGTSPSAGAETTPTTTAAPVTETNVPTTSTAPATAANGNEEGALKEEIANTLEELKNKADELLSKHRASPANLLTRTGILSRFPRLTGNFIFQAFITGAPIAGFGGSNLGDNLARTNNAVNIQKLNGARCTADSECISNYCNNAVPRVCAARQVVRKANGQSCARGSDCNSGVCYKKAAADANGLCGKKQGLPCRENPECLSLTCGTSRVCAKSVINEPCLQNSDCSTGNCNVNTKKCAARVTPVAPPAPEAPALGTSSTTSTSSQGTTASSGTTAPSTSSSAGTGTTATTSVPMTETNLPVSGTSSTSSSSGTTSTSSTGTTSTAPVVEAQFDVNLAQSILDGIYVKMNELKQKVCLEASKHSGINMGNIKCGSTA